MNFRLATIDVGSNAMRLEMFDVKKSLFSDDIVFNSFNQHKKSIKQVKNPGRIRIPVRLGYEAFSNGQFSDIKIEEAVAAFEYFRYEMEKNKVDFYLCSATSASRTAVNGAILAKNITERTGIRFRIIDGLKESQLLNLALSGIYDAHVTDVLADLGGGSLELNFRENGNVFYQTSMKIGTVRLLVESNFDEQKMSQIINRRLKKIQKFLEQQNFIKSFDYLLTPGGNAEDLVDMAERFFEYSAKKDQNMTVLPLDLIEEILKLLELVNPKLRAYRFNLRIDRGDVIYQAGTIFKTLGKYANVDYLHIPSANLNYGILYDLIGRLKNINQKAIDPYTTDLAFKDSILF